MKKHIRLILLLITIICSLLVIARVGNNETGEYAILGTLCLVLYELLKDKDLEI